MVAKSKTKATTKKIKRSSKKITPKKPVQGKYTLLKKGVVAAAGFTLAAATLLAARKILNQSKKSKKMPESESDSESDSDDDDFRKTLNLEQKIQQLNNQIDDLKIDINKERQGNSVLVNQINQCNKEVVRQRGVISSRPSLLKEATMRSTIKKMYKSTPKK